MAFLELDNSKIISNQGDGLFATSQSLASGQTNTISANALYDVEVADDALVKLIASSVYNLSSPNNVMNPDGSRIELSTASLPAPSPSFPTPYPVRRAPRTRPR
jgi:hypothetical protein